MKQKTLVHVLIALALALICGKLTGTEATLFSVPIYRIYALIGELFLNALTLVVVPLVVSSIITGSAKMGSEKNFGRLGGSTFLIFLSTTFVAVLIGFSIASFFQPGALGERPVMGLDTSKVAPLVEPMTGFDKFASIATKIIPSNILYAASHNQMLGLILFSLFFGFFASRIEKEASRVVLLFFQGLFQIMMSIVVQVMRLLPLGVFGLVAKTVAETGFAALFSMSSFVFAALFGFFVYVAFFWLPLLSLYAKVDPLKFIKALSPALFTAFSTSSSAATLPVTIECVEKEVGVSNRVSSFTLPLGVTLHLSGTALYNTTCLLFIGQVFGFEFSFINQALLILLATITSFGMAGIPSGGLVSLILIMQTLGLPSEGIALLLPLERVMDMIRTPVNTFGNASSCLLIAKSLGETTNVDRSA